MRQKQDNDYWLGKEAFINKDYNKAKEHFTRLIEVGSEFADVYNMLGIIYHERGMFDKAIKSFEKALTINPNYTDASMNLAVIYNDMGKLERSKKIYKNAKDRAQTKINHSGLDQYSLGKLSNMHADLADIYAGLGLFDDSIDEYNKSLQLNPDFADIRSRLGNALRDAGRIEEAIVEFHKVIKTRPDFTLSLLALGMCYYKLGKLSDAKKYWETVLSQEPDNKIARFYLKMLK